ncbi:MAG: heparan-alpha-glucosaminide N-acetyltransferase domain-containing protein [Bacillota bacterium]
MLGRKKTDSNLSTQKTRCWELDFMRGFAILMVLLDHTMFDISSIFGSAWRISDSAVLRGIYNLASWYVDSQIRAAGWVFFVFVFFFVSGICTSFSRNNILRGLKLVAVAALISLVTYVIQEGFNYSYMFIWLGVIHCLSFAVMFYAIMQLIITLIARQSKYKKYALLITTATLVVVSFVLNMCYNVSLYDMAYSGETAPYTSTLAGVFVYTRNVWYTTAPDYFPILPFFCFFMIGAIIGQTVYRKHTSLLPKLNLKITKPFSFCGRHSLLIYLAIQVIMLPVLYLITLLVTGSTGMI